MKNTTLKYVFWIAILLVSTLSFPSCAVKSGCPAEVSREQAIKANKKKKRDKPTELFSKDVRKKMKG
ncbi:MAG: hypothetical protein IPI60_06480 [Saprospiraceae bacterium]|nr:hypothetical protein [Saprospiraceae bacterium]